MGDTTTIEWTDATWNPITGCTLVDQGCRICYAAELAATRLKNIPSRKGLARRNAKGEAKFTGEVRFNKDWLDQPLRWRRPRMVFVCAHGDLFHDSVPDEWIDRVFAVMALAPRHTFQVLTKRPERARRYLQGSDRQLHVRNECLRINSPLWDRQRGAWPLPNIWLGTSVSDQASADLRIPPLLETPAAVRFLSAEPLLGPVDLKRWLPGCFECAAECGWRAGADHLPEEDCSNGHRADGTQEFCPECGTEMGTPVCPDCEGRAVQWHPDTPTLDWVIVGGESGRTARPMHPDWARSLRDQCQAAGVPFFFKQWGKWLPETEEADADKWDWGEADERGIIHTFDDGISAIPLRKARAGRLLDGREWSEFPPVTA